eukprot:CAMPEP_0174901764 /NCGR_PEP_ID=MMETSP0167-20121228/35628_1 /TAXON_ID=38298 /ORGANISM="Rhodella maculata, Strain CCMP736" /LENGTH=93 /DNA_ID=CAMNT_0016143541 /DNA_START=253 /DNA_END=531 /DNA_ORIENTATION=-
MARGRARRMGDGRRRRIATECWTARRCTWAFANGADEGYFHPVVAPPAAFHDYAADLDAFVLCCMSSAAIRSSSPRRARTARDAEQLRVALHS